MLTNNHQAQENRKPQGWADGAAWRSKVSDI